VRLGWALFGLWLVFSVAFLCVRVLHLPRPAPPSQESREFVVDYYDPDESLAELYASDLWSLVRHGSIGQSFRSDQDSGSIAVDAMSATAAVVIPGLILALLLALMLAVPWSRAGSRGRYLWRLPGYIAIGLLPLWLAVLLSKHIAFDLGWFPLAGYCDFFDPPAGQCGGGVDWVKSLVLPWFVFGAFFAAIYARVVRAALRDVRAAGKEDRQRRGRRSRFDLARFLGRDVGFAIGAAAFVETAFTIPGLGNGVLVGVRSFDPYVVETFLVYAGLLGIGMHFLADVVVGALDSELRRDWPFARLPGRA
jgi:peptide/nickel transport system permease protein